MPRNRHLADELARALRMRSPLNMAEGGSVSTGPVDDQDYLDNQAYWDEIFRAQRAPAESMEGGSSEASADSSGTQQFIAEPAPLPSRELPSTPPTFTTNQEWLPAPITPPQSNVARDIWNTVKDIASTGFNAPAGITLDPLGRGAYENPSIRDAATVLGEGISTGLENQYRITGPITPLGALGASAALSEGAPLEDVALGPQYPFLPELQATVGDVGALVSRGVPMAGAGIDLVRGEPIGTTSQDVGRFIGEAIVPTRPVEVAGTILPKVGDIADINRALRETGVVGGSGPLVRGATNLAAFPGRMFPGGEAIDDLADAAEPLLPNGLPTTRPIVGESPKGLVNSWDAARNPQKPGFTTARLQNAARGMGLDTTGTRAELIERIRQNLPSEAGGPEGWTSRSTGPIPEEPMVGPGGAGRGGAQQPPSGSGGGSGGGNIPPDAPQPSFFDDTPPLRPMGEQAATLPLRGAPTPDELAALPGQRPLLEGPINIESPRPPTDQPNIQAGGFAADLARAEGAVPLSAGPVNIEAPRPPTNQPNIQAGAFANDLARQPNMRPAGAPREGFTLGYQRLLRSLSRGKPLNDTLGTRVGDVQGQLDLGLQTPGTPRADLSDHVFTWWQNSILSSPKSWIVNALGNQAFTLSRLPESALSAAIDIPLHRLQGRDTARFFEEVPAAAFGMAQGIPDGVRSALHVLKTGQSTAGVSKWTDAVRKPAFQDGISGRLVRTPYTVLEATDAFNYEVNYASALAQEIRRQALSEGRKGAALVDRIAELKRLPTPKIIENATQEAEYRLFRDDPGSIGKAIMELQKTVPGFRYVAPFVRTPANLLGAGLERSPLGLFNPELYRNLKNADPRAADQLARIALGSSVSAALATMVAGGTIDITGAPPRDPSARDRFYREGKQPYAIKVGDNWVQYQRLEPFNQPLAQLAAVVEAVRSKDDKTASNIAWQMAETLGNNLTSQTYLSGLSNFMDALSEPRRYGERLAGRTASGFVPASAALRSASQAIDPTYRDPQGITEQIKAGVPGLSKQVPPRLDAFGNEAPIRSSPFNPINITESSQSAVDAALEELGQEVGFVGDTISNLPLNRDQQFLYQRGAGQHTYNVLNLLVSDPRWDELPEVERVGALRKVVTASRDIVQKPVSDALDIVVNSEQFTSLPREQQEGLLKSKEFNTLISQILQRAADEAGKTQ